jgi:tripartite-type tricarboxylate transporter receptor subunit TctC
MSLSKWLAPAFVAATAIMPLFAAAQAPVWPARAIHVVVPYGPGGYTDTYTRLIAAELAKTLNQPVLVENKAGNSGNIGSDVVAKAAPDGYTLLMGGMSTHAISVSLYRNLPFDPIRDFTPISPVASANSVLLVNPSTNLASVGDLLALTRAKPDELSYGGAGIGTPSHLNIEALKERTGVRLSYVPYKGEADALLALMRGDIVLASMSVSTALPQIRAGRVRPIAVAGSARSPTLPDVPLLSETVPGIGSGSWIGLFGPAGLPGDIVHRINREVDRIMRTPEMHERITASDLAYTAMTPAEFAGFQKAEIRRFAEIIRANGIRIE